MTLFDPYNPFGTPSPSGNRQWSVSETMIDFLQRNFPDLYERGRSIFRPSRRQRIGNQYVWIGTIPKDKYQDWLRLWEQAQFAYRATQTPFMPNMVTSWEAQNFFNSPFLWQSEDEKRRFLERLGQATNWDEFYRAFTSGRYFTSLTTPWIPPANQQGGSGGSGLSSVGGGGGNWWGGLPPRGGGSSSSSFSSNWRMSYSGLLPPLLPTLQNLLTSTILDYGDIIKQKRNFIPNLKARERYSELAQETARYLGQELSPVVQERVRQGIENLAQKGVLDSTVASRTLSDLISRSLAEADRQATRVYLQGVERAINYPREEYLDTLKGISVLAPLLKIAISAGAGESQSQSQSSNWDWSPFLSLLQSLLI